MFCTDQTLVTCFLHSPLLFKESQPLGWPSFTNPRNRDIENNFKADLKAWARSSFFMSELHNTAAIILRKVVVKHLLIINLFRNKSNLNWQGKCQIKCQPWMLKMLLKFYSDNNREHLKRAITQWDNHLSTLTNIKRACIDPYINQIHTHRPIFLSLGYEEQGYESYWEHLRITLE